MRATAARASVVVALALVLPTLAVIATATPAHQPRQLPAPSPFLSPSATVTTPGVCGNSPPSFFPAATVAFTNATVKDAPLRYAVYMKQLIQNLEALVWPNENCGVGCVECNINGEQASNKQFSLAG